MPVRSTLAATVGLVSTVPVTAMAHPDLVTTGDLVSTHLRIVGAMCGMTVLGTAAVRRDYLVAGGFFALYPLVNVWSILSSQLTFDGVHTTPLSLLLSVLFWLSCSAGLGAVPFLSARSFDRTPGGSARQPANEGGPTSGN